MRALLAKSGPEWGEDSVGHDATNEDAPMGTERKLSRDQVVGAMFVLLSAVLGLGTFALL